jgi:hypothetical protein
LKYACVIDDCIYESKAKFGLYDKNNKLVDYLVTDDNGVDSYVLGYGSYSVKQLSGLKEYTLSDDFTFKVRDEDTPINKELFNYKIIEEGEVKGVVEEPKEEVVETPPDTKITFKKVWEAFKNVLRSICLLTKNLIFRLFML